MNKYFQAASVDLRQPETFVPLNPVNSPTPQTHPHPTMTSFFDQTAQSFINLYQYHDRFPLLKITHLLDW